MLAWLVLVLRWWKCGNIKSLHLRSDWVEAGRRSSALSAAIIFDQELNLGKQSPLLTQPFS